MQTLIAFLLVALGVAVDATYNKIRRNAEYEAFIDGYRQAQKEEKIRLNAENAKQTQFYRPIVNTPVVPTYKEINTKKEPTKKTIPQSFMDDLQKNGRAAIKLGGAQ